MTSASELFYNRRSRRNELGFDSPSPSPSPSFEHNHRRRYQPQHHYHHQFRDCDPIRRSSSFISTRHLGNKREHKSAQVDFGTNEPGTGSSRTTASSSSRANRLHFARNDQLPGAVLLARERLLERLRGVSLTGNRQTGGRLSEISWNEITDDDFGLADSEDWESESSRELLAGGTPLTHSSTQNDLFSSAHDSTDNKKPAGLSQEEVNYLGREIFKLKENPEECGICLEGFSDGDSLICLPCNHRFHSTCLNPWVQICGDCPYCRTGIVLHNHKTGKEII
ncbi:hypothetical protein GIB67_030443 [Kingdonia uniflora]|uniref:RING-type domain-containing protein n=1 Tax=Kingdonia uniflora TaxID=39325 RepID=A0A7J7NDE9_9MAGN|nr:hypothetical protein GIB67_030443 [Kingdonia uniflora]